jgi:hypothetical protein
MVVRKSLSDVIEATLDYRRNPGAKFLGSDLEPMSLAKTEVFTAAQYAPSQLSVPVEWSKMDDVKTPSENSKIAFVDGLLENALNSHDDLIEEALFASSTQGFVGLPGLFATSGQGSAGGIDSGVEVFWRHPADSYSSDGSDIEAVLTEVWNTSIKGSGNSKLPKVLISGSDACSLFESTQQPLQRYNDQKLRAGFNTIHFKVAPFTFSQYGSDEIYGLNDNFKIVVSKQYFRDRGKTQENDDANGFRFFIYSALQTAVKNKSQQFVANETP